MTDAAVLGMLTGLLIFLVSFSLRQSFRARDLMRKLSYEKHAHFLTKATKQGLEKQVRRLEGVIAAYERDRMESRHAKQNRRLKPRPPGFSPDDPDDADMFEEFDFAEPAKGAA